MSGSVDRSMARETLSHARVASEGPSPTVKGDRSAAKKPSGDRSAGACPPRAFRRRALPVLMQHSNPY